MNLRVPMKKVMTCATYHLSRSGWFKPVAISSYCTLTSVLINPVYKDVHCTDLSQLEWNKANAGH